MMPPASSQAIAALAGSLPRAPVRASSALVAPRDLGFAFFGAPPAEDARRRDLGAVRTGHAGRFYQRTLPPQQVPFASEHGRRLFREALAAGTLESFFFLAEQFRTQDEPTFCGLSTLAMVLNSLRIDPMRTWKGAWRWFNEENLGGCAGPDQVRAAGLSFDMFKCLATCNGAEVVGHRGPLGADPRAVQDFEDAFRAAVRAAAQSGDRECIVASYSREVLGQSGAGHFSPIGGYHEGADAVLILDVARFKYPPHWARLGDVAQAMCEVDPDTARPRGWLQLRPPAAASEDCGLTAPLRIPFLPAVAGRRLSDALSAALAEQTPECTGGCGEAAAMTVMRRWLRAASNAEPQILAQLLRVGDASALQEVLSRLEGYPLFRDLCSAYARVAASSDDGMAGDFPPLRIVGVADRSLSDPRETEDRGLGTCGELWVLLLLLLPEHLRAAVAPDVAGPAVARGVAAAVRGPWALPLEALREALGHAMPSPRARRCAQRSSG